LYGRPTRARLVYLLTGILAVAVTEIGRTYYRPFIYRHRISDFHVADTLGNSFGTVATVFVALAIFGRGDRTDRRFLVIGTVSVFVYELAHPLLGRHIDPWDLAATVIAGLFAAGVYRLLHGWAVPQ
jgi:hypothetical protein